MNNTTTIRVLIIDDDEDDFFITSDYIKKIRGPLFFIDWCHNYANALKNIAGREYDIYFLDYRLGANTGLDLLKEGMLHNCEEPIILLTGNGNQAVAIEAMEAGATDYLVKSELNTEKLERCIRYALDRAASVKQLKTNERKFRNIFEKSKDTVFIASPHLVLRDINQEACGLFGYTKEELLNTTLYKLMANQADVAAIEAQLADNGEVDDKEMEFLRSNGEKVCCILSLSTEADPTGERHVQGIIHDITNIKKAEKATLQAEKLRATGRLVSILAHEVRNPLNNITLAASQLHAETAGDSAKLYLDIINRNSNRIKSLITELLLSSGPAEIVLQRQLLQPVVEEAMAMATDRATLKKIKLNLHYQHTPLYILADKEKLKMALLNIIMNAIEAMADEKGVLFICTTSDGIYNKVLVADNGCGISEENLSRLFEPYFTSKRNGLGLGLTATLNILQAHSASVDVKSQLGEGTSFTLLFTPA